MQKFPIIQIERPLDMFTFTEFYTMARRKRMIVSIETSHGQEVYEHSYALSDQLVAIEKAVKSYFGKGIYVYPRYGIDPSTSRNFLFQPGKYSKKMNAICLGSTYRIRVWKDE